MADPITVSDLKLTGRLSAPDANLPRLSITYDADFRGAADTTLEFTSVNQQGVFGVPRSLFIDNGSNPSEVEVSITGTNQFFTIPANAEGYFHLECQTSSAIRFVTAGGATDRVTIVIYNWEVPPSVWYKFGAFNKDIPIQVQGGMREGDTVATDTYNRPAYIGGIDRATGLFHGVGVDSQGRLDFAASITVGSIFGPDPTGGAPTKNPVYIAALNVAGNISNILTSASNRLLINQQTAGNFDVRFADTTTDNLALNATADAQVVNSIMRVTNSAGTFALHVTGRDTKNTFAGGVVENAIVTNAIMRLNDGTNNYVTTNIAALVTAGGLAGTNILASGLVAQRDDTATLAVTEDNFANVRISADRSLIVVERSKTGSTTAIASSAVVITLLAANDLRKGASIYNDSTQVLYVKRGAAASLTDFDFPVQPGQLYTNDFGYVGIFTGIWPVANGNARVSEIV